MLLAGHSMPEKTNQNIDRARKLGSLWCVVMHDSPTWPIHGEYRCRTCGRQFPVPWAAEISMRAAGTAIVESNIPAASGLRLAEDTSIVGSPIHTVWGVVSILPASQFIHGWLRELP